MKKVLSILMCLVLLLSTLSVSIVSVSAESYGDFEYKVLDGDTVEILGFINGMKLQPTLAISLLKSHQKLTEKV